MVVVLIIALASSLALLVVAWLLHIWLKNPGIVDVFWPLAIMLNAFIFGFSHNQLAGWLWPTYVLLVVWGLRLACYLLFTRIIPKHVDKRYVSLSESWKMKQSIGFLWNFLLQGFLAWVLAIPFLFVSKSPMLTWLCLIALAIIALSIVLEVMADKQLQQFKRQHPGKVCNVGLWQYSRHPNLFFEWLVWLGFALVAISMSSYGWLGLVSPLLSFFIMYYLTGPITEKGSLQSRGEAFKQYQQSTSYFFPWFKG